MSGGTRGRRGAAKPTGRPVPRLEAVMLVVATLLCAHAILLGQHDATLLTAVGAVAAGTTATWIALIRRRRQGRGPRPAWILCGSLATGLMASVAHVRWGRLVGWQVDITLVILATGATLAALAASVAIALPPRTRRDNP